MNVFWVLSNARTYTCTDACKGLRFNRVLPFFFCPYDRIKYAALSFSRSLSANSGTDTVVHYYPGTDPDIQINFSPDGCVLSNNSSQGWRTNYRGDYKDQNLTPICTQDLLSYAFQVARGMEYLSQRRVKYLTSIINKNIYIYIYIYVKDVRVM